MFFTSFKENFIRDLKYMNGKAFFQIMWSLVKTNNIDWNKNTGEFGNWHNIE